MINVPAEFYLSEIGTVGQTVGKLKAFEKTLRRLATEDATVRFFMTALEKPNSHLSLYEMLVSLVSALAEEKKQYHAQVVELLQQTTRLSK